MFYLLELSLSEYIEFVFANIIAAVVTAAMTAAVCKVVLRSTQRGLFMDVVVLLLYAYSYVLLNKADYALLVGSISLIITLGVIVYVTRHVDWSTLGQTKRGITHQRN